MSYTGPDFVNGGPPAINAANLNGMVAELEEVSIAKEEVIDAHQGIENTSYSSLGNSIRGQVGIVKSDIDTYKAGKDTFPTNQFIRGSLSAGGVSTERQYRIVSENHITTVDAIPLTIQTGFRINAYLYSGDSYVSIGWQEGSYTIPAGSEFVITIARVTEDHSEIANIPEFLSKVIFPSDLSKTITAFGQQIASTKLELDTFENNITYNMFKLNKVYGSQKFTEIGFYRPSGTYSDSSTYRHTDYISIKNSRTLIITGKFGTSVSPAVFYNSNKQYISGYKAEGGSSTNVTYTIPVPDNAEYVISSCSINDISDFSIDIVYNYPVHSQPLCYISPNGNDNNDGLTENTPVRTAFRVREILADNGMLVMLPGDYDYNIIGIDFSQITNVLGVDHPRILCYSQIISSAELVSGYTKVYSVAKTFLGGFATAGCFWQHDIPDANTVIPEIEAHPLNRNRTYRLPSTRIMHADSIEDIEASDIPKWYIDEDTIYFSIVADSDLETNPVYIPTSINSQRYKAVVDKNTEISIKNIAIYYNGFDLDNACGIMDNVEIGMCRGEAVVSADYCESLLLRNCNFYAVSNSTAGDAVNVHNDDISIGHRSLVTLANCWLHDCSDDGESCHANSNTIHSGCLIEYNGTGITPAGGGTVCNNVISRHHGPHSWVSDTVVCAGFSCQGDGSTLVCDGCVSENNVRGYSDMASDLGTQNCLTIINSSSINNRDAEIFASRGIVETDNIKVINADASKHYIQQNNGMINHKSIDMGVDSTGTYIFSNNTKRYL